MTAAKNAVYWVITWKLLLSGREIDLWWEGNKNLVCVGGMSKFTAGGGTPPYPPVGKTTTWKNPLSRLPPWLFKKKLEMDCSNRLRLVKPGIKKIVNVSKMKAHIANPGPYLEYWASICLF